MTVTGARCDNGERCTLLLVVDVGGSFALHPHGADEFGVRIAQSGAEALARAILSAIASAPGADAAVSGVRMRLLDPPRSHECLLVPDDPLVGARTTCNFGKTPAECPFRQSWLAAPALDALQCRADARPAQRRCRATATAPTQPAVIPRSGRLAARLATSSLRLQSPCREPGAPRPQI